MLVLGRVAPTTYLPRALRRSKIDRLQLWAWPVSDLQLDTFEAAVADRYMIQVEIGRGSRATVYRARDVANDRMVALKVLRSDLASALDSARFLKQMQNVAGIVHPGILPVLDVGELAGRLYCVTPFLTGESLRSRLTRDGRLPLSDAVAIARQVADALGHAHVHGVLHKDVKPENIFVDGSQATLTDLGLSRAITRSIDETMTGSGLSLGTPAYMSPEHARGGVEIDARADLYSLGCVLYEMLAGEPPFTGDAPHKVWMRTLTDTPVPITTMRDGLPLDVGVTLDRLLAKAPSARFPDAAHLVEALSTLHA
jgi:serine/threonine-protein kinase